MSPETATDDGRTERAHADAARTESATGDAGATEAAGPAETELGGALQRDVDRLFQSFGISGVAQGILMIVFGVLVIVFPELIAWLIGGFLIIAGAIELAGHLSAHHAAGTA